MYQSHKDANLLNNSYAFYIKLAGDIRTRQVQGEQGAF